MCIHSLLLTLIDSPKPNQTKPEVLTCNVNACSSSMIPSDIITNILHRLPAKSMGRFRCVSKGWLSLLTDPRFIKTHQNTLNQHHLIFRDGRSLLYSHPFDDDEPILTPTKLPFEFGDFITFHGSCEGLVLLSYSSDIMGCLGIFVLLNPTTREFVQLPQCEVYYHHESLHMGSTHGVGYDSVTDDYKVITINYFYYFMNVNCAIHVSLYSLRNNSWRRLNSDCPYKFDWHPAVYVNGFLHWFGNKTNTDDDSWVIVAFSLADECFSEVPLPGSCNGYYCKLVAFGGKLAMCPFYSNFEVWLMNEYGVKDSWTKIPLDRFVDQFCMVNSMNENCMEDSMNKVCMGTSMIFYDNGKIRVANQGVMLIYDFEKITFSENAYCWNRRLKLFGSYVESLVSPKRKDTMDAEQIQELADSFVDQYTTDAQQIQELADSWEGGSN